MALGLADLFTNGFAFLVDRLIAEGGGLAELRERFRQLHPGESVPHANTLNALINRVRQSSDIAGRINRGVKPRATSFPQVPRGFDCEGYIYKVIVPVKVPEYGSGRVRTVDVPMEIQTPDVLRQGELKELVLGGMEAMKNTRDNYQIVRLGVIAERFDVGDIRVSAAYRC